MCDTIQIWLTVRKALCVSISGFVRYHHVRTCGQCFLHATMNTVWVVLSVSPINDSYEPVLLNESVTKESLKRPCWRFSGLNQMRSVSETPSLNQKSFSDIDLKWTVNFRFYFLPHMEFIFNHIVYSQQSLFHTALITVLPNWNMVLCYSLKPHGCWEWPNRVILMWLRFTSDILPVSFLTHVLWIGFGKIYNTLCFAFFPSVTVFKVSFTITKNH